MAQITKNVDKTTVSNSERFIYTINASFSDLVQPTAIGRITDFFPDKINYYLPPIGGSIKSITETSVSGGTVVTFNLGTVTAGTSVAFNVGCEFGTGRVDGDSFTNTSELYADDIKVGEDTASTVNLRLTGDFGIIKTVSPTNVVNAGDELTFSIFLNSNNFGGRINNVVVTDVLPPQLIPVTSFIPVGYDVSTGDYADHSADGLSGSWSGNTLTFNLPSYAGERYEIKYKARVSNSVSPGEIFQNIVQWTIDENPQQHYSVQLRIYDPASDDFALSKGGPYSTIAGAELMYFIDNTNTSPTSLSNYILSDPIPTQLNCYAFRISASGGLQNYIIQISLDSNPTNFMAVTGVIPGGSLPLTYLTGFIPPGDRIHSFKLIASSLNSTLSGHAVYLYCITNSSAVIGDTIINTATATSGSISKSATAETIVRTASEVDMTKSTDKSSNSFFILEEFTIDLTAKNNTTMTVNPVFIDLLPIGLRYISDSEYFSYYDDVTGTTFDSRNPGFPVPTPTLEIIEDFNGTGQTLLRWSFQGLSFILPVYSTYTVSFKAFAEIGAPNNMINNAYEGVPGIDNLFTYNPVVDTFDMDDDGFTTDDYLSHSPLNIIVLESSEFLLEKLVKGQNDLDFSSSGKTVAGGNIDYRLQITNNHLDILSDIEIVDILPFIGDTGVILISTPRGSEFEVHAISHVTAEVISLIGDPVDPNPDITIEYSTSNDPKRFDELGNPIGTGNWSTTPPVDITRLRSVRITTGPSFTLKPYERLIINFSAKAPIDAVIDTNAYNSYAVRANRTSGSVTVPMLPTEPNKVVVNVEENTLGTIGDYVWNDLNQNGLFDPGEPGVNGILVELYSDTGELLSSTVTSNDLNDEPGYYLFTNLPHADYQVKFTPTGVYTLTQQKLLEPNGSRPNPSTGLTNLITVSDNVPILDIDAGVYEYLGTIGDFVWDDLNQNGLHDPGEPGVNGITVELYSDTDELLESTITANNESGEPGYYLFTNLQYADYKVKFIPTGLYSLTQQKLLEPNGSRPDPSTGFTNLITVSDSQPILDIDAGLLELGAIGDFVWDDLNRNGLFDPGEPGVNGITVELYSETGELLDSTITADNEIGEPGYYLFSNLMNGIYQVKFVPSLEYALTQQKLLEPNGSRPDPLTGFTNPITIANSQTILDIDAGLLGLGAIGDFVWDDLNRNGLFDPGEPGVNGITVELYSDTGELLDSTITADNDSGEPGYYLFSGLVDGIYQVKFDTGTAYHLTRQKLLEPNGSRPNPLTGFTNLITISNGQTILDIDAGLLPGLLELGTIGDFVWNDLNRNGLFDPGEPGMNGITVEIYSDTGELLDSRVTADSISGEPGYYLFSDLMFGDYQVKFIPISGYVLTQQNTTDPNGSRPDPSSGFTNFITLANTVPILDVDAGIFEDLGSIGDFVWNDLNGNGLYDPGEPGVNGITVELYSDTGVLLDSTITANNENGEPGYYMFSGLRLADYQVKFVPGGAYLITQQNLTEPNGSRPDPSTGFTNLISVVNNQPILDVDAGLLGLGAIGDFVWNDLNENGLYDPGEPGVNGITVELYSDTGVLLDSTITADDLRGDAGYYLFTNLPDGAYQVKFVPSTGYFLTLQKLLEPNGSRPDPTTGFTNIITILNHQPILDIDAGLLDECGPPVIHASDICIHVGDTFDPMKNVRAEDCNGKDITNYIIITENNVNTNVPGIYKVTYKVTDDFSQTSQITVSVKVCFQNPCQQAITDLIRSAALEQAALSHILNAEGEKIQKAIELNLSNEELLNVNNSVSKTIQSIMRLEMIIQGKLSLLGDDLCKGDCCIEIE